MTRRLAIRSAATGAAGLRAMRSAIAALLAGSLLAACEQAPRPRSAPLVVATFYPLYEFARQVAGDRATVVSLIPPGVEPHDWEPAPRDIVELKKAQVFVHNGTEFEPWVQKVVEDLEAGGTTVVAATHGIELARVDGALDPHVWLDPVLARGQVDAIEAALSRVDPDGATTYRANAQAFRERLDALDRAFASGLANCESRDIVTSHAAFGYLARRYRLNQVPVLGLAPESEPSPAELAAIARLARDRRVRAVFFETLVSPRLAETLAREIGGQALVLNPLEGLTQEEAAAGKGYVDLMEGNLANLRTGLGCQ